MQWLIWAPFLKGGFEEEGVREMKDTGPQSLGKREAGHKKENPTKIGAGSAVILKGLCPRNTWNSDALQTMLMHNHLSPFL